MKAELKRLGKTKKQFAEEIGYNYRVVCNWGEKPPEIVRKYLLLLVQRKLDGERICHFVQETFTTRGRG